MSFSYRTSTTSTLDATVTSFAPCATYNPEPHNTQTQQTRQKRTPQFGYPDAVPTPQQKQKRNIPSHLNPPAQKNVMNPKHESDFFTPNEPRAVGGMCDAGVYCVNSTFVSDAPPSWGWGAVELAEGQTCLGDELFNVEWVEEQCECAGM